MDRFLHELDDCRGPLARAASFLPIEISRRRHPRRLGMGSVFVGIGLTYGPRLLRWPLRAYVDCIRGTPVLVLILAAFYLLAIAGMQFHGHSIGPLRAFDLLQCAYGRDRARRAAVDPADPDRCRPEHRADVSADPRLRAAAPGVAADPPGVDQHRRPSSSRRRRLLSVIGVGELLLKTQETVGRNFMTLEFYAVCGVLFFLINFAIERLGKYAETPAGLAVRPLMALLLRSAPVEALRRATEILKDVSPRRSEERDRRRSSEPSGSGQDHAAPLRQSARGFRWRRNPARWRRRSAIRIEQGPPGQAQGARAGAPTRQHRHGVPELQPVSRISPRSAM